MIRDAFLSAAQTAAVLLREPAVSAKWSEPSALADFSVAGLARHLANRVTRTVPMLAGPPGESAIPVLEHYTRAAWVTSDVDGADNVDIRRRGEQAATATTPQALADEVDAALAELRRVVPAQPVTPGGRDNGAASGRWGPPAPPRDGSPAVGDLLECFQF